MFNEQKIYQEAERIRAELQAQQAPNSPNGTHYMAQISPDFMRRASTADEDRLYDMLPWKSLTFTGMKGLTGHYAVIDRSENRAIELRAPKAAKIESSTLQATRKSDETESLCNKSEYAKQLVEWLEVNDPTCGWFANEGDRLKAQRDMERALENADSQYLTARLNTLRRQQPALANQIRQLEAGVAMFNACYDTYCSTTQDMKKLGYEPCFIHDKTNGFLMPRDVPLWHNGSVDIVTNDWALVDEYLKTKCVGIISFAQTGETQRFYSDESYLDALHEELPDKTQTGMSFETLNKDPALAQAVQNELDNLYGIARVPTELEGSTTMRELAVAIEAFVANHEPAYGYSKEDVGFENEAAARASIERFLRNDPSHWLTDELGHLRGEPELEQAASMYLKMVATFQKYFEPQNVAQSRRMMEAGMNPIYADGFSDDFIMWREGDGPREYGVTDFGKGIDNFLSEREQKSSGIDALCTAAKAAAQTVNCARDGQLQHAVQQETTLG